VTSLGIRVALVEPGFIVTPILDKALESLTPDPSSPYADIERRILMMFGQARVTGGTPRQVAETVEEAISTSRPKLRYPVGIDAHALIPNRARMTDEDWIALGRTQTDEQYFTEFAARFPMAAQA
jgi:NAD(P)-dependent dehydrogenase (short-subunit alcohol dehydrogenase family)